MDGGDEDRLGLALHAEGLLRLAYRAGYLAGQSDGVWSERSRRGGRMPDRHAEHFDAWFGMVRDGHVRLEDAEA